MFTMTYQEAEKMHEILVFNKVYLLLENLEVKRGNAEEYGGLKPSLFCWKENIKEMWE